jgi:hypothetical protein
MKLEVLYIRGCPNHRPAVEQVFSVLDEMGIAETVYEIPVETIEQARTLGFPGSPTIRIDDEDIEKDAQGGVVGFSISCRTYIEQGKLSGIPSRELIRRAIYEAL